MTGLTRTELLVKIDETLAEMSIAICEAFTFRRYGEELIDTLDVLFPRLHVLTRRSEDSVTANDVCERLKLAFSIACADVGVRYQKEFRPPLTYEQRKQRNERSLATFEYLLPKLILLTDGILDVLSITGHPHFLQASFRTTAAVINMAVKVASEEGDAKFS